MELRRVIPNKRDEAHQRSERHPAAAGEHRAHPADQSKRKVQKRDQQIAQIVEGDIQQQKDADAGNDGMHDEVFARLRLRLSSPAVDDIIPGRELDVLCDAAAHIVLEIPDVAADHARSDCLDAAALRDAGSCNVRR